MKQLFRHTIFASSILLVLFACKKSEPTPSFHYEYFGMQEGRYVIYDVVEIDHEDQFDIHDTTYYQLKTVWDQPYIDNEGRRASEFHRFVRSSPAEEWTMVDVWTGIIVDARRAEMIEENQRKVKLVFAPTSQKIWDANAYNMLGEQECYYEDIHKSANVGGNQFDSTLIVEYADQSNLVDDIRIYERYAKGVGMIEWFYKKNNYQGAPEVDFGKEIYYTFVSTGIE